MLRVDNVFRKGVDKTIEVFKLIADKMSDYKLVIIGPKGEGSVYVEKLINESGLQDRIILTGEISESKKINYLMKSKYYFQLSAYEGFGLASIEALAAGNLVFHSGKGGLIDALGEHGVKVNDINDYKNIAELLYADYLNQNDTMKKQNILNGINYVKESFSLDQRKDIFKEVIK